MSYKRLITQASQTIYDGFIHYNKLFGRITRRAKVRFEQRDWIGHQQDIVDRVDLYEKSVRSIALKLRQQLGKQVDDHELWNRIRFYFGRRLHKVPDADFIKTFFNSVTRRIFGTIGIDPQIEFTSSEPLGEIDLVKTLNLKRYPFWGSTENIFSAILEDFSFRVPYVDSIKQDIQLFLNKKFSKQKEYLRFEFIDSFFYQATRAYLVGRLVMQNNISPLVIAFKNGEQGIMIDAVLTDEKEVTIIFSYTRSYYFANPNSVIGAVYFIHSILPKKPLDELYTVLGRLRQGKTERHRLFSKHLQTTTDEFIHADGDRGLVMIVFNLASYNLVFKIIKNKFDYPKTITHDEVISKYRLVSEHDRAGRLIDTQEFLNLELPIKRFSEQLLDDLLQEASNTVSIIEDNLLIKHVYIERRVRPLNLYINEVDMLVAKKAILDYGKAIKDLAKTNIFPGDLLLKNFGVTRHERVLFYDYDEVNLVSECNFRDMPKSRDNTDEFRAEPWYYVSENDIFPEEFIKFLSMNNELRELFLAEHGELLTATYWREIQSLHETNNMPPVVAYNNMQLAQLKKANS